MQYLFGHLFCMNEKKFGYLIKGFNNATICYSYLFEINSNKRVWYFEKWFYCRVLNGWRKMLTMLNCLHTIRLRFEFCEIMKLDELNICAWSAIVIVFNQFKLFIYWIDLAMEVFLMVSLVTMSVMFIIVRIDFSPRSLYLFSTIFGS